MICDMIQEFSMSTKNDKYSIKPLLPILIGGNITEDQLMTSMKDLYKKHSIIDENYSYLKNWLPQQISMGKVIKLYNKVL